LCRDSNGSIGARDNTGTTLGMMIANVPAVLLGDRIANKMPVRMVHAIAAAIFAILGFATLLGAGERLGF
jgi:putative Ca2+/H+ antiporter (TMEM165/GDT1 family)